MLVVFNRRYKTRNQKQTGISRVSAMPMNTRRLILSPSLAALATVLALIWSGVIDCCPHITFLQPTCDTKKERIKKKKNRKKETERKKNVVICSFLLPRTTSCFESRGGQKACLWSLWGPPCCDSLRVWCFSQSLSATYSSTLCLCVTMEAFTAFDCHTTRSSTREFIVICHMAFVVQFKPITQDGRSKLALHLQRYQLTM